MRFQFYNQMSVYGLRPCNQESIEYLEKNFDIPERCWLGDICYLEGRQMQTIIDDLELHPNVEIFTDIYVMRT